MIDVKLIAKKKNNSGSSGESSSSSTTHVSIIEEAKHALKADNATFADQADYANRAGYSTRSAYADKAGTLDDDSPILTRFLSRIADDIAEGYITFKQGLKSIGKAIFEAGIHSEADIQIDGNSQLGKNGTSTNFGNYIADSTGATIKVDDNGTSYIEADYLTIRRAADFREITIRELRYIGGELAITPAAMQACKVERLDASGKVLTDDTLAASYFKCYFETTDGSGESTRKVYQEFVVGDQARCQQFGISEGTHEHVKTKYYWRLVTEVGDDYIVLSNKEGEKDPYTTSEPSVNDNIIQLGYQGTEYTNRQSAIILSATATDAPSQKYYQGINDFSLDHVVKDEGYDKVSSTFHSNTYGDSYVGDKGHNSYFKYDANTKTATFSGTAHFDSASTKDGEAIATVVDLDNIKVKSGNLLRNTSFCGNYESVSVDDMTTISEDKETFSESVEYWSLTNCTIEDDEHSLSGRSAFLKQGTLSQVLDQSLTIGEEYVLSFCGCGSKLTICVGGVTYEQEMTADYAQYNIHIVPTTDDTAFSVSGEYSTICEIMLTQGAFVCEWNPAYSDNDKSLAEMQSLKYLTDAINNASTTIDGGLVMTQQIKVGNYRDRKMTQETGGMSGYYNDDDSAFLWGGGTMTQALYTIQMYKSDPTYQASADEVANMAKFVVTHGGRAILNDIILRGYIYAEGGILKSVQSPNGSFKIDDTGNASFTGEINATSGYIGGFKIKDNYLTGNTEDGTMTIHPSFVHFAGSDGRDAVFGQYSVDGRKGMIRVIDEKIDDPSISKQGMIISVRGSVDNSALELCGGYVSGINYKNQIIGFNYYGERSTTPPTQTETLSRYVCCVLISTECSYYDTSSKSKVQATHDVVVTLPSIEQYDDGHCILFKRYGSGKNTVTLKANTYIKLDPNGNKTTYQTAFCYDRGTVSTELQLESEMDSFELRFFPTLSITVDSKTYNGIWVQFKHPRDW